jgi:hypothetical protein
MVDEERHADKDNAAGLGSLTSLRIYFSTSSGTCGMDLYPPNAVPFHERPVICSTPPNRTVRTTPPTTQLTRLKR